MVEAAKAEHLTKGDWGDSPDNRWDKKRVQWVLDRLDSLKKVLDEAYIEISELLFEVVGKQYYRKLEFTSFEDYCDQRLQMKDRKGWYLHSIYKNLVHEAHVPKSVLKDVEWSLAREVASLPKEELKDGKALKWLEKAKTMKHTELLAEVRKAKNKHLKDGEKRHNEEVQEEETFLLYPQQKKNVLKALELARRITQGMNKPIVRSNLIDMICLEFNASRMEEGEVKLNWILEQVERVFGVECVAIQVKGKNEIVVHGKDAAKRYGIE